MIVIVGGGISGLTLAHELEQRGVDHLVLEASERVGGVIRSGRLDGQLLEFGPQRARLTGDFARLVDELGLRERLIEAPRDLPLYVYRAGRLRRVPFSARDLVTTDLLSWPAKLRLLAEPLTRAARDEESVGSLFRRKLGRDAYDDLAGPLYGGLYASDPDDMVVGLSLRHTLRELGVGRSLLLPMLRRAGRAVAPAACSFVDGLEELPRALYEKHRARISLNAPVRALARTASGWRVELTRETIDAKDVVICTPSLAAWRLLAESLASVAEPIGALVYNPLAVVHLQADTSLRGLGYQVSLAESLVTRGVTFNESLFARAGVYTAFMGGANHSWVAHAAEEELAEVAAHEFRTVTGAGSRPISVSRQSMPAWDRSWQGVQGLELPSGLHVHASWYARPGLPGRLAGSRQLAEKLARG